MFLFDTKRGHCEYFASAMVAMCQSVGIPARIVAGYVATEFNAMTGQYTVRESNAHAWAEVRIAPGRWLTMDPSPPGDIERIHAPSRGVLARLKSWYDLIEFNWNEAVVTFDSSRQTRLFRPYDEQSGSLQQAMERARTAVRRAGRTRGLISGDDAVSLAGRLAWWGAVAFVLGGIVYLARKRLGGAARGRSGNAAVDEEMRALLVAARLYPRALRRIERAGLGKPRGQSGAPARRGSSSEVPEIGEPLGVLAGLYEQGGFGRSGWAIRTWSVPRQHTCDWAAVRLRRHGRASIAHRHKPARRACGPPLGGACGSDVRMGGPMSGCRRAVCASESEHPSERTIRAGLTIPHRTLA